MEMFKPAWMSANREKALKEAEKITDRAKVRRREAFDKIMKIRAGIFLMLSVCLLSIFLSGCGNKNYHEDALLVKKAFEYLNADNTLGVLSLVDN